MEQSNSLNKVLKISSILLSGSMLASLLGIVVVAIITKNISLEQYGIVVMVQAYIMFVDQLFNFQSWQALIKYGTVALEEKNKNDLIRYIQLSIFLDLFGSFLALCFAFVLLVPMSKIFNFDINLLNPYLFYSIIILFRIIGTPTALLRLTEQYKYFNYQLAINWIIKLILTSVLVLNNSLTIYNILIAFLIGEIVSSIYLIYFGIKALNKYNISLQELSLSISKLLNLISISKRFLLFSLRANLNSAVLGSIRTIDELIVGALLGPASAAIFKIMKLIGTIVSKVLDPLYVSSYPEFSKMVAQNKKKEILHMIKQISTINFVISSIVIISFYFFGDLIIKILFTENYLTGLEVIQVYLIGVLISFVFFYAQPLMLSYEYEGIALGINTIAACIYIFSLYYGIQYFGLWAIAFSFLLFNGLVTLPKLYFLQVKTKLFLENVKDY